MITQLPHLSENEGKYSLMDLYKQVFFKGDCTKKICFGFLYYFKNTVLFCGLKVVFARSTVFFFYLCGMWVMDKSGFGERILCLKLYMKNTAKGWRKPQPSLRNWKIFLAVSVSFVKHLGYSVFQDS